MKALRSKQYWLAVLRRVCFYLPFVLTAHFLFREEGETLWQSLHLASALTMSLMIALVNAYDTKQGVKSVAGEEAVVKPTLTDFAGVFLFSFLIAAVFLVAALGIGLLVFALFSTVPKVFFSYFSKTVVYAAIISLFNSVFHFTRQWRAYRRTQNR